jgi:hypothetical protein
VGRRRGGFGAIVEGTGGREDAFLLTGERRSVRSISPVTLRGECEPQIRMWVVVALGL